MPPDTRPVRAPFGVNVVGFVTGNLGLGVAARNSLSMLKRCGVPVAVTDIDPGFGRAGHDTTHALNRRLSLHGPRYLLTLFHVNPLELASHLSTKPELSRFDRLNAIVPFWELESLPPGWAQVLDAMDLILTPSRFIRAAVEEQLPDAICIDYPQTVYVDDSVIDRERWGMPPGSTVFVTSFDVSSTLERKNPAGVVEAFQLAFPERRDVQLILKANGADRVSCDYQLWGDLVDRVKRDDRLRLVTEVFPYADVLSLYASADCLVSLHRSEGLGLSLMEAMMLGKPVIATAWSGNLDFMTPDNSRLVDYTFIPARSEHPSYRDAVSAGARWADPSVADAAQHMRAIADDPASAGELGRRARDDMLALRRRVDSGEVVDLLREAVAPGSPVWLAHPRRRRQFKALARGAEARGLVDRARRAPWPIRVALRPGFRIVRRLRSAIVARQDLWRR